MNYRNENLLIGIVVVFVFLLVFSKWNFHTGSGDEQSSRNNGFNLSVSLFGDSTINQDQDGAHK